MELSSLFGHDLTVWLVIPLLIFFARILDVSLGTLRVIFVAKGIRLLAPLLGFFEVLIWLLAIGQIMQNLTNWVNYLSYAGGFAMGNFVGMTIEARLALGKVILRIITHREADKLVKELRDRGYGLTSVDAEGKNGPVKVLFMLVERNELTRISEIVNSYNPRAFYSIEDVRFAREGIFPTHKNAFISRHHQILKIFSKTK